MARQHAASLCHSLEVRHATLHDGHAIAPVRWAVAACQSEGHAARASRSPPTGSEMPPSQSHRTVRTERLNRRHPADRSPSPSHCQRQRQRQSHLCLCCPAAGQTAAVFRYDSQAPAPARAPATAQSGSQAVRQAGQFSSGATASCTHCSVARSLLTTARVRTL